jgi:hypothetical protein
VTIALAGLEVIVAEGVAQAVTLTSAVWLSTVHVPLPARTQKVVGSVTVVLNVLDVWPVRSVSIMPTLLYHWKLVAPVAITERPAGEPELTVAGCGSTLILKSSQNPDTWMADGRAMPFAIDCS